MISDFFTISTAAAEGNFLERMGDSIADVVERWMPSPFLFAIILTYIAFIAAIVIEGTGPFETVTFWFDGFWLFLTFAMQMVLILMTGFVVAYHPRIPKVLRSGIRRWRTLSVTPHTNLLNPFWAIPLLAITGISARKMFGYAVAMLLLLIPFLAVVLFVLPYF